MVEGAGGGGEGWEEGLVVVFIVTDLLAALIGAGGDASLLVGLTI